MIHGVCKRAPSEMITFRQNETKLHWISNSIINMSNKPNKTSMGKPKTSDIVTYVYGTRLNGYCVHLRLPSHHACKITVKGRSASLRPNIARSMYSEDQTKHDTDHPSGDRERISVVSGRVKNSTSQPIRSKDIHHSAYEKSKSSRCEETKL